MATKARSGSARALWSGAISFGLVHVPVQLYSSLQRERVDFDLVDKRDMAHIGYQRYNKTTGREVPNDQIVRGVALPTGKYVTFDDDELKALAPEGTKTIDIAGFTELSSIAPEYWDTPYVLAPGQGADKVYALLRDSMTEAKLAGVATIVLSARQHLAALIVRGPALVLHTLRWASELRDFSNMAFPPTDRKKLKVAPRELEMAGQLVTRMKLAWDPSEFHDTFRERVLAAIAKKSKSGGKAVAAPAEVESPAELSDLSELLRLSLSGPKPSSAKKAAVAKKPVKAAAKKRAA